MTDFNPMNYQPHRAFDALDFTALNLFTVQENLSASDLCAQVDEFLKTPSPNMDKPQGSGRSKASRTESLPDEGFIA